ncbi:MAG: hypothetical protein GF418_12755 [Chitinivibrionales bacterium]|nr:hypothetical protein [Chitinivibrionales bacterium]MBD3396490.1 hypothetical protein [Chitinivibrionales bacterium]
MHRSSHMLRITLFLLTALLAGVVHAGRLGGQPGAYLRAPVGADACARGGANTAAPRHLFSWWNPSMLVSDKERRLTLGGAYRSLGRTEGICGWEFRVPPRVGMGLSVLYRGDPFLNRLYDEDENELERGAYSTLTFKIGLAYLVTRVLYLGGNVSAFYQSLPVGYRGEKLRNESSIDMGGFDFGARLQTADNISFGLVVKNLGAGITLNTVGDWDYDVPLETKFLPSLTLGSQVKGSLRDKPFIWSCDLAGYLLNGDFEKLEHPVAVLNNGFEWQNWDTFHIRAGIRDIDLNGDMVSARSRYRDAFSFAVTAGFLLDLSSIVKGLSLNYAFSTDKVWAGVENQLDFLLVF